MILLEDQFQGMPLALGDQLALAAPLALADQAFGTVTVGIDGGTMTVAMAPPVAAPPGGLGAFSSAYSSAFNL